MAWPKRGGRLDNPVLLIHQKSRAGQTFHGLLAEQLGTVPEADMYPISIQPGLDFWENETGHIDLIPLTLKLEFGAAEWGE
jgi:hypothetical protein